MLCILIIISVLVLNRELRQPPFSVKQSEFNYLVISVEQNQTSPLIVVLLSYKKWEKNPVEDFITDRI